MWHKLRAYSKVKPKPKFIKNHRIRVYSAIRSAVSFGEKFWFVIRFILLDIAIIVWCYAFWSRKCVYILSAPTIFILSFLYLVQFTILQAVGLKYLRLRLKQHFYKEKSVFASASKWHIVLHISLYDMYTSCFTTADINFETPGILKYCIVLTIPLISSENVKKSFWLIRSFYKDATSTVEYFSSCMWRPHIPSHHINGFPPIRKKLVFCVIQ